MISKGTKYVIVLFIVIGIFSILISLYIFFNTQKEIRWFEDEFAIKLPQKAEVIFSEDTHGAMGDGVSLYIYQISSYDMPEFLNQSNISNWHYLPLNSELLLGLQGMIKGVSSEKITSSMNLSAQKGYFYIKNRYNKPLKFYNFQDPSFKNIVIGIIDLDKNKIYYFTLDI